MLIVGSIVAAVLGLVFGSFLNVCVTRLPLGESVAWPGSHCRSCNHAIPWYWNIPAFSWLALGGRCAYCKQRISVRYLALELGTAILWVGTWLYFYPLLAETLPNSSATSVLSPVISAVFVWLLLGLAAMDWEEMFLSDWFTLPGTALGLVWAAASDATLASDMKGRLVRVGFQLVLSAGFAGFFLFIRWFYWLIRRKEGLGFGDVKLAAMIGAWLSWEQTLITLFLAVIGALLYATFLTIRHPSEDVGKMALPFGSFLAGAAIAGFFYGECLWTWYLGLWHLA
jgi:leader peptidase (prepilin peptidase)/N-methyltransferase